MKAYYKITDDVGKVWSVVDVGSGERWMSAEEKISSLQEKWKRGDFTNGKLTPRALGAHPGVIIRPILL